MPTASTRESGATSLKRGLDILERVARTPGGVGFTEFVEAGEGSRATTARLLRVLRDRDYLVKQPDGRYGPGPAMAMLGQEQTVLEKLTTHGPPLLESLSNLAGNTTLLVFLEGRATRSIAKHVHPASIPMQEVGSTGTRLEVSPWGWVFAEALGEPALAGGVSRLRFYRKHGYAYDDQHYHRMVRRLAAPVRAGDGRVVAAIAIGGNRLTLTANKVPAIGRALCDHADRLSHVLGWSG